MRRASFFCWPGVSGPVISGPCGSRSTQPLGARWTWGPCGLQGTARGRPRRRSRWCGGPAWPGPAIPGGPANGPGPAGSRTVRTLAPGGGVNVKLDGSGRANDSAVKPTL